MRRVLNSSGAGAEAIEVAKKNNDEDRAGALLAIVGVGIVGGWWAAARDFVAARLPLFVALGTAVVVLAVLVLRRRRATARVRAAAQRRLDAEVASTDGMSGADFEQLVARLMTRDGFADVRVPGGRGDLGADVVGSREGRRVVVQCKRYSVHRSVSSPEMQKFLGTCFHEHDADEAWFVTTTRFSGPARELGERRGVRLVDRQVLAEWMASSSLVASSGQE